MLFQGKLDWNEPFLGTLNFDKNLQRARRSSKVPSSQSGALLGE
jgi:hypothetical protein